MKTTDEVWMRRALSLAEQGRGSTSPNPLVGAVLVRDGEVVGEGYHERAGGPHAEIRALAAAGEKARGATLYVTLEPCCHHGLTPPCTQAILAAGVRRVVAATIDPNALVNGKGIATLRAAGLEVEVGLLADEAREQNRIYFHWITSGTPYVVLKWAMSADGKVATVEGDSRYLSGEEALREVHRLRSTLDAVLVGSQTVRTDDPLLTVRLVPGRQPRRVVLASRVDLPEEARLFKAPGETIVVGALPLDEERAERLRRFGADVVGVPAFEGWVDLPSLLKLLGSRRITSLLVEGGPTVLGSFLDQGIFDELHVVVAPLLLGGRGAPSPVAGKGVRRLEEAFRLGAPEIRILGKDIWLTWRRKG